MDGSEKSRTMGEAIQIDEVRIGADLVEMVRGTVEEALVEMYPAGVSVRRVEDITEACGAPGSAPARCRT